MTASPSSASAPEPARLDPCPETPNCVSTQAERSDQRMEPIPFGGDLDAAKNRLLDMLEREPRVRIVEVGERLVRTVFTTRILRFKDDVVFLFDAEAGLIHFRSASRIGRSDLGANRDRMERLTRLYLAADEEATE